jgi:hypothetical protein
MLRQSNIYPTLPEMDETANSWKKKSRRILTRLLLGFVLIHTATPAMTYTLCRLRSKVTKEEVDTIKGARVSVFLQTNKINKHRFDRFITVEIVVNKTAK